MKDRNKGKAKKQESDGKRRFSSRKVAFTGVFACLALILGYVEYLIPFNFGIPGVRLGLANLATVSVLYLYGEVPALSVSAVRIILSSVLFGNPVAFAYSLCGGMLSFAVMALLKHTGKFGITGVSIAGGTAHNIAQLAVAALIFDNFRLAYYLPILLISGAVTGLFIGLCSALLSSRIGKTGISGKN